MEQQGAFMASSEMALFQMLGREYNDASLVFANHLCDMLGHNGSGWGVHPYTMCD
jgi:hypothetical protein